MKSATIFREYIWLVNTIHRHQRLTFEEIIIRAFGREVYYLRDLPLHHTQRELEATPEYTDFELTLRPTADFITPLLSRGSAIKVLAPPMACRSCERTAPRCSQAI